MKSIEPKQDLVVVVTGGSRGLGLAIVNSFSRLGYTVFNLDVAKPEADSEHLIQCDVSQANEVEQAFAKIKAQHHRVDILVNNAGIQRYGTVTSTDEDLWDDVINTNLKSAFLCSKAAIPLMQSNKHGVIVNIASAQSFMSQENVAAYTTSKTALLGLTRSIAIDYAPHIRSIALCPSTVDTPMLHEAIRESSDPDAVLEACKAMHLTQSIAEPNDIAELVLFLCSEKAKFITGQSFRIDGGLGLKIDGSPV